MDWCGSAGGTVGYARKSLGRKARSQVTDSVGEMPIPVGLPVERQMPGRCCNRNTLTVDRMIEKTAPTTRDERECRHPLD